MPKLEVDSNTSDTSDNNYFEIALRSAMTFPGVKIDRRSFLRKELSKYFGDNVAEKAVKTNPAQAELSVKDLEKIAKSCISYETAKATAISAATGIPGGLAMAATVPADVAQFFVHIIRILQKLVYLYGWQDIFNNNKNELDDETFNQLTLFIGVMFGVNGANVVVAKIAKLMAVNMEKTLVNKALTKGAIYPIVKKIAKIIGVQMTKGIFAKGVGKIIPVVGALISGGITFASFGAMANRLQKYLVELPIASVEFYKMSHNDGDDETEYIDFSDIIICDVDESEDR